jgi:hypothetical protein
MDTQNTTSPIAISRAGLEELDFRSGDGLEVTLLWSRRSNEVVVAVLDTKLGDTFEIPVGAGQRALEVFHHPFAYEPTSRQPRVRQETDRR